MKSAGVFSVQAVASSQSWGFTIGGFFDPGRLQTPSDPGGTVPDARSGGCPGPSLKNSVDAQPAAATKPAASTTSADNPGDLMPLATTIRTVSEGGRRLEISRATPGPPA